MKCKVKLTNISRGESGYEVTYEPVTSGSPENETFFKYTPYGKIVLGILNDKIVKDLEPGREYYIEFTEAM